MADIKITSTSCKFSNLVLFRDNVAVLGHVPSSMKMYMMNLLRKQSCEQQIDLSVIHLSRGSNKVHR